MSFIYALLGAICATTAIFSFAFLLAAGLAGQFKYSLISGLIFFTLLVGYIIPPSESNVVDQNEYPLFALNNQLPSEYEVETDTPIYLVGSPIKKENEKFYQFDYIDDHCYHNYTRVPANEIRFVFKEDQHSVVIKDSVTITRWFWLIPIEYRKSRKYIFYVPRNSIFEVYAIVNE